MSSPSKAQSSTFAATASEVHLATSEYYSVITVTNGWNAAVAICTDGGTSTAGNATHLETLAAGQTGVFGNLQPLPQPDSPSTNYQGSGWTSQSGWVGTNLTMCSVIAESTPSSGDLTIAFS